MDQIITYTWTRYKFAKFGIFGNICCFLPETTFLQPKKHALAHPNMYWNTSCEHHCANWTIDFRDWCCILLLFGFRGLFLDKEDDKPTKLKSKNEEHKTRSKETTSPLGFYDRRTTQKNFQFQKQKPKIATKTRTKTYFNDMFCKHYIPPTKLQGKQCFGSQTKTKPTNKTQPT